MKLEVVVVAVSSDPVTFLAASADDVNVRDLVPGAGRSQ